MNETEIKELQKKYAEQIGGKLRTQREKAGYSQEELGQYIAKTHTTVSRYEYGTIPIPASDIPIFADLFEKSPAYFFEFEKTIMEECRIVQETIRKCCELMAQVDTRLPEIDTQEYIQPRMDRGVGKLADSAISRLSDMGMAYYLYQKKFIKKERLEEYTIMIRQFDYSEKKSYFENFDFLGLLIET